MMDAKSSNHKRLFRQLCNVCSGDHWNDNCPTYATVEERKQILKKLGSCYVCLKRGHRAFECLTKKTCYFCKKENYHHRSLCHQNVNNYSVPLNKTKLFDFNQELSSRQDSLVKSKLQGIKNTADKEPLSEPAETSCYSKQTIVSEYSQILNELRQTKSDLEDSKKENVILKEKISKLEAEQEILETSVSGNTATVQKLTNEIIQLKEILEYLEHTCKNVAFSIDAQDNFASDIAGGKIRRQKSNDKQRIGTECRFANGNGNHGALNMTYQLQKSCSRLQHTYEDMEECSFLETEKAQRKGDTVLTKGQSAGGGTWKNTEINQIEILKTLFKGLTVPQTRKTASLDIQTNNEEIVYAWMKVLSLLTQSQLLK